MSKRSLWILFAFLVVVVIIVLLNRKSIDGRLGGILRGPSHEEGGIKAEIRSSGEKIELEGDEGIINRNSMLMNENVVCQGTPAGVASAVNEIGGGVKFDRNGRCWIG